MINIISQTGFNITSSKFDTTGLENPFYETSSIRGTLIEQMKNNIIIVDEVEVAEFPEQNPQFQKKNKQEKEENTMHNNE